MKNSIFTWRVFLAVALALFVLEPMLIWGTLTLGPGFAWITWGMSFYAFLTSTTILLIFYEIFRHTNRPLTDKEMLGIMVVDQVLGLALVFQAIPWIYYFTKSPSRLIFGINPPEWWAPREAILAVDTGHRSLLIPAWSEPVALIILVTLVSMIMEISLGYLFFHVRVIEEKLTFPAQAAVVETLKTLGGAGGKTKQRLFLFSLLTGIVLGIFNSLGLLSLGYYDLNYFIEKSFPGAALAIFPLGFFRGFILPWKVILVMFLSAFAAYFVGNHLLVAHGIWRQFPPSPGLILRGWTEGMTCQEILYYSTLNFWVSIIFGFAIALGIVPIVISPRKLLKAIKVKADGRKLGLELTSIFTGCSILIALVVSYLTGYPLPPLLFLTLMMSFILSYAWTGLAGVTGYSPPSIPYLKEAVLVLGAGGKAPTSIWFASPLMRTDLIPVCNAAGWTGRFMQCYALGVKFKEYITLFVGATIAAIIIGLITYSIYWSFAPIPSALYPGIAIWEAEVIDKATWMKLYSSRQIFKPNLVVVGFITGMMFIAVGLVAKAPWIASSILAGLTADYFTYSCLLPALIGALVRDFILPRAMKVSSGESEGDLMSHAYVIATGVEMGFVVWAIVLVAVQFIYKSLWVLPY